MAGRGEEFRAERAAGATADESGWPLARENDQLRGELLAVSAQLAAARASIEDSAAAHQEELEALRSDLEGTKHALVTLKGSISWKVTRPLRALRALLRRL